MFNLKPEKPNIDFTFFPSLPHSLIQVTSDKLNKLLKEKIIFKMTNTLCFVLSYNFRNFNTQELNNNNDFPSTYIFSLYVYCYLLVMYNRTSRCCFRRHFREH